ncbi:MAG: TIGR02147 family protein, partial [Bdellovibrionota bacterium]
MFNSDRLQYQNYRQWLEGELTKRCEKNPKYSLRAFARTLGLSPSQLSRILSGKRPLSVPTADQIAFRLGLPPQARSQLLSLVVNQERALGGRSKKDRKTQDDPSSSLVLSLDAFAVISAWYHYAITELTQVEDFKSQPRWIASRLGITIAEANAAVKRLVRLGVLSKDHEGNFKKTADSVATTNEIRSSGLRKFHKQILQKAMESLEEIELEKRDVTAITMAIDPKNLPKTKQKIQKFRKTLCSQLEKGRPTEVYTRSIQLFPLTL